MPKLHITCNWDVLDLEDCGVQMGQCASLYTSSWPNAHPHVCYAPFLNPTTLTIYIPCHIPVTIPLPTVACFSFVYQAHCVPMPPSCMLIHVHLCCLPTSGKTVTYCPQATILIHHSERINHYAREEARLEMKKCRGESYATLFHRICAKNVNTKWAWTIVWMLYKSGT